MRLLCTVDHARQLDVPEDIGALLDAYARGLAPDLGMVVTRQQAFERFTRITLANLGTPREVQP